MIRKMNTQVKYKIPEKNKSTSVVAKMICTSFTIDINKCGLWSKGRAYHGCFHCDQMNDCFAANRKRRSFMVTHPGGEKTTWELHDIGPGGKKQNKKCFDWNLMTIFPIMTIMRLQALECLVSVGCDWQHAASYERAFFSCI